MLVPVKAKIGNSINEKGKLYIPPGISHNLLTSLHCFVQALQLYDAGFEACCSAQYSHLEKGQ